MIAPRFLSRLATLKSVSLPTEHGGWGFLFEPMLLGMLLAPSRGGAWLCAAGLGAFLARRPFMVAFGDLRYKHWYPRTGVAVGAALLLGSCALAGLVGAFQEAGPAIVVPLILAVPLATVFLYHDAARHARSLSGELSGALAMGALAPAILTSGGWPLAAALGGWLILGARAVTSIIYVRAQVRRLHGREVSFSVPVAAHVIALATVAAAASRGLAPILAVPPFVLMLARAWHGARHAPSSARALGWSEMRLGLATVLLLAAGYAFRL